MVATATVTAENPPDARAASSKTHIRGSGLLLVGRIISLGLNFAVNVLLVRALSKGEFGAFSYALAIGSLGTALAACGLHKATARYVPIYQERADYPRMLGVMLLAVGLILGIGISLTFVVWVAHDMLARVLGSDPLSASLLAILVILAPLQAMDRFLANLLAIFAHPATVFWRKHVLGPALKLSAVLLLVLTHAGVHFLAVAYVVASALGTLLYVSILVNVVRKHHLWSRWRPKPIKLPVREFLGYSVPLASSDLVYVLRSSFAVFLLEYFSSSTSVAEFRAALPVARLNNVAYESFMLLFLPMASRMFARGDHGAINDMYWQTTTWIAVLTFPAFAVTFLLSGPLTVLLFGTQYADSGQILSVLALGCYLNATLGFNAATLKVYGKVRMVVINDAIAAVAALSFGVVLIQRFGAIGAAWAVSLTYMFHNLLNQAALIKSGGIVALPARYARACAAIVSVTFGMFLLLSLLDPPLSVAALIVLAGSGLVLWVNRALLDLSGTFPELFRLPVVGRLFRLTTP